MELFSLLWWVMRCSIPRLYISSALIVNDIEALLLSLPNKFLCCALLAVYVVTTVDVRWLNTKSPVNLLSQRTSSGFFLNVLPRPKSYLYLYFSIRDTVSGTVNRTSQQNITY
jgi:hypothetical protein